jgi:protein phosphatase
VSVAGAEDPAPYAFEVAVASDVGTGRKERANEDHCAHFVESASAGLVVVADGVSGLAGGGTASRQAVETTLRTYRELADLRADRRLLRAVQKANIDVYDLAVVVPELRGMATTLTAAVVDRGELVAAHVGDCRLYLLRAGRLRQLTKDHSVAGERVRMGFLSEERARFHPDRSVLTRALGRELIVAIDRIAMPLAQGDRLILCSDGLYNVIEDGEIEEIARGPGAGDVCRTLVDTANRRGTPDNLTVAMVRMIGAMPERRTGGGLLARLRRLSGRDN